MGLMLARGGSSSSLPSWHPAVGAIVEIDSGTTVGSAVRAEGGSSYPGSDPDNIVKFWGGGAIVQVSGQPYLVAKGGGHSDSAFNGIVKFGPLYGAGSDSPSWSTFLAPSATNAVRNAATYTDGRQSATHTYNNIVGVDDVLYEMATDGYYSSGYSSDSAYKFTSSGQTALAANPRSRQYGAAAHHDGKIYYHGASNSGDQLRIYDIAGDSWTSDSNTQTFANYVAAAADTTRGGILVVNGSAGVYWKTSDLTQTTGHAAPTSYDNSLEFDPVRDVFVSVVDGSQTVYELDAAELAAGNSPSWTSRTFTGATPSAAVINGTYGRFRYVSELGGYILVPGPESSVYFYRSH